MTISIYGFLSDTSLVLSSGLDLSKTSDQGFGVLRGEPANYLVTLGTLNDTRDATGRLAVLDSSAPDGQLKILFDQDRADLDVLRSLSSTDCNRIFNILERVYFQGAFTDIQLETLLTSSGSFSGYVPNSVAHGDNESSVIVKSTAGVTVEYKLRDYTHFEYRTGDTDIVFHIWHRLAAFAADYPFTTITKVIPPYSPKLLLDPSALLSTTNLNVLSNSSAYVFGQVHDELSAIDQNGIYQYTIKYVVSSTSYMTLSFALAYCGAHVPSTSECRAAIKAYMLEATGTTEAVLSAVFPDLGIDSRFYIVPMWDMYTARADGNVYNSIAAIKRLLDRRDIIFNFAPAEWRAEHLEILLNAQNTMFSLAMPDANNTNLLSILEQHPTYVNYSTQIPGWKYMTAATQEFAGKLIRCMAVLNGESLSAEFLSVTENNADWLVFTSGASEYFVMTRPSYENLIGSA